MNMIIPDDIPLSNDSKYFRAFSDNINHEKTQVFIMGIDNVPGE